MQRRIEGPSVEGRRVVAVEAPPPRGGRSCRRWRRTTGGRRGGGGVRRRASIARREPARRCARQPDCRTCSRSVTPTSGCSSPKPPATRPPGARCGWMMPPLTSGRSRHGRRWHRPARRWGAGRGIALVWGVATYNGFVRLRNLVEEAWRQVDVELHRRYDLIPNLVETRQGVRGPRAGGLRGGHASPAQPPPRGRTGTNRLAPENALTEAIGRLFAVAEAYPVLRASEQLPGPAGGAHQHRGPHRRRSALLQRERAPAQHEGRELPSNVIVGCVPASARRPTSRPRTPPRAVPRVDFGQGGGAGA